MVTASRLSLSRLCASVTTAPKRKCSFDRRTAAQTLDDALVHSIRAVLEMPHAGATTGPAKTSSRYGILSRPLVPMVPTLRSRRSSVRRVGC